MGKKGHDKHVLLQTLCSWVHSFVLCCIRGSFGCKYESSIIKTASFFFNLQHWETRSCKADDFTEFERSVVLQNDYINATLSFTVWSLYARACCKCCSLNLSASPLVSCDVGKQQTRERSVGVPWGQVNLSG